MKPEQGEVNGGLLLEIQPKQCELSSCGNRDGGQNLLHEDKNIIAYGPIRDIYEDTEVLSQIVTLAHSGNVFIQIYQSE